MTPPLGGFAPATPQKENQNLSMKEEQKNPAPSRWSGKRIYALDRGCGKGLLKLAAKG
jgi:hypothetical protein